MTDQPTRYTFTIDIGDWSGDGHSDNRVYHASATAPIEVVREAYFVAKAAHPTLCPETYCNRYEDDAIRRDVVEALRQHGAPLPEDLEPSPHSEDALWGMDADAMAEIVAWFLNLGNPALDVRIDKANAPPRLAFYGCDNRGRHIGFIGYGVTGN